MRRGVRSLDLGRGYTVYNIHVQDIMYMMYIRRSCKTVLVRPKKKLDAFILISQTGLCWRRSRLIAFPNFANGDRRPLFSCCCFQNVQKKSVNTF